MKKELNLTLIFIFFSFGMLINAQNYSYSLVHNNAYSFSVVAVPDFDSGSFEPVVQLYGFTLVVPEGVTLAIDDIQPSGLTLIGGGYNVVPGSLVVGVDATMSDKDLLVFATDPSTGIEMPSHVNNQQIPLITFTVEGAPNMGLISLLDNASPVGSAYTAFASYFTVDATDDSIDSASDLYSGQTGMTSFDFSTLTVQENNLQDLVVYPNPVKDKITMNGNISEIKTVEIYNLSGQLIKTISSGFDKIDVGNLQSAIYFLKVSSGSSNKTIKFVKD